MKEIKIKKKKFRKGECSYDREGDFEEREVEVPDEYSKHKGEGSFW